MSPLRLVLFLSLSAAAIAASLHSWRTRQAYGLFRFLGFEVLAVLIVWNAGRWFREPLSPRQLISWIVFLLSTVLAAHGIYMLRAVGRAQRRVMEDTQSVVEVGAYRYIRHPLYASLILFAWGAFLKGADFVGGALAVLTTAFLAATARSEENFNLRRLGGAYAEYMRRTKMFIPFVL